MWHHAYSFCFAALLTLTASACGDSDNQATVDSGVGSTSAAITGVETYGALTGSATIETTTTGTPGSIELLADGNVVATANAAPFALTFDTTTVKDGVVELSLRCDGQQMADKVKVIVLNKGQEVSFSDGTGGTIAAPADGNYVDQHLKYHWQLTKGFKRIVAVLSWDNPTFELELTIGAGECPDSGTVAELGQSKDSPLAVSYGSTQELATGMWFAHVDYKNRTDTATHGKDTTFAVKAYLLVD